MKIMHLLKSSHFSGAENVATQIISIICSYDESFEMIYCSTKGSVKDALESRNIRFFPLDHFSVSTVKKAIKQIKPDIIHAHDMHASFVAALCCGKIPLISHIHNNAYNSRSISVKSISFFLAARKAKHIFWVSKSSFEGYFFHSFFKKKSSILYNIVDVESLNRCSVMDHNEYNYDLVFIGRLTYPKNPERLLTICSKLAQIVADIKVAIIGKGELETVLLNKIIELKLENNIDFLGYRQNPYKILRDSKIMVMTSRWEGTPMVALEAMALGIPIISTPVDGLKDIVTNGENGFLLDSDDEIAKHIFELLCNQEKLKEMSNNQIKKAIRWNDKEKYASEILKVYRDL